MSSNALARTGKMSGAIVPLLLFLFSSLSPVILDFERDADQLGSEQIPSASGPAGLWDGLDQPWGQYGRTPTHNGTMPAHAPDGGPGEGSVADVSVYGVIDSPIVNWVGLDDGADAYGSIIGDFSNSVSAPPAALERCAYGELFAVMVWKDGTESILGIMTGDDAKIAWQVNLGETLDIRSTPIVHDIDDDGKPEILVVYDTSSSLQIEMWSPELTCSESGWQKNGHSNEKVWSYSDTDYRIGIESPHTPSSQTNHRSVTQPILADLEVDGVPELVIAAVDQNTDDPTVLSFSLTTSVPSEPDWDVSLDRGTHPSDPTWAALDGTTTAIVLTTIDSNSGNMWIWRIDGASGSLDWERVAVQGTDSDTDSPRLRLPGPVIVQLDEDAAPEMILTVPTDANGATSGSGARYIGMELTSTSEIFNFRAQNGYADAQPLPIDTTDDGIHDRLCWVTWYSESSITFNRKGMLGCHDISLETPIKEWTRDLQRGTGNDNDEIAVSSPIWMDIVGNDEPEIIVAFGQRLWAFDGESGASADINNQWSSPLAMPHRVWAGPAVADMDGDGTLDILIGDTLVSQSVADFAPLADGRGISFNPAEPDPGQQVTITGQFSNIGTMENDDDLDVVLYMNGNEIKRERFDDVEPVAPSGEGGPLTFSAVIDAELGIHNITMVLDVNENLTEARKDNNMVSAELVIVEPYVAQIDAPSEVTRVSPGTTESVEVNIMSTGSRTVDWSLTWDDSALPSGWTFSPQTGESLQQSLTPNAPMAIMFEVSIPSDAMGDENSYVDLTLTYVGDSSVYSTVRMPLEVLRTRGLSVTGPTGLAESDGYGRIQGTAKAWMVVENLGNAQESTASIDWTATSWGGSPSLHTADGTEIFALTLQPKEDIELFAHLDVPASQSLGSTTTTTLTLCIGSGDDTLCQDLAVEYTAVASTVEPLHSRSLPNSTLSWQIDTDLPFSGELAWNMVDAQMIQSGWQWTASGALSMNGSRLEMSGSSDGFASGVLTLYLPPDAVPQRHSFVTSDTLEDHSNLTFSLQVLQIFRSQATLLEPLPESEGDSVSMNVSEGQSVRLRLENPGNGEDEFLLTAAAHPISGQTLSPPVEFEFVSQEQRMLGPLAYTIATVEVTLGEEVPAESPFELYFQWTSLGDESVFDYVTLLVEAEPDHRWNINLSNGNESTVSPSEEVEVAFTAQNLGNANDTLRIVPSFTHSHAGNDASVWHAEEFNGEVLQVNESEAYSFSFTVPETAWADSVASMSFAVYSDEILVDTIPIRYTVRHVSGWSFNLANTSLTIDPAGQNLTLTVEQRGNAPQAPYYDKAGAGWNISYPENGVIVQPGESTTVTVFVSPPEYAVAGEIGILKIRISDADGSGSTIQDVPVRVGDAPNMTLGHKGIWRVNDQGGMPTAWVENTGNDVAVLELGVSGLPNGWTISGPTQMVVAPQQVLGIPLNLIPSQGWSGEIFLATLEVTHPVLGLHLLDIEVEKGQFGFATTPVVQATTGKEVGIEMNTNTLTGDFTSNDRFVVRENTIFVTVGSDSDEIVLISTSDTNESISLYLAGYQLPDVTVDCSLLSSAFSDLGTVALTGRIGECNVEAGDGSVYATLLLLSSTGERIQLTQSSIELGANENGTYEVNVSSWSPDAGSINLELLVVDSYGRTLSSTNVSTLSRSSGWNIGIFSFTSSDGDLTISIQREQYQRLEDVTCRIHVVDKESTWTTTRVVDIVTSDYAPVVFISNPQGISDKHLLEATLVCDAPYDIDDNPDDNTVTTIFYAKSEPVVEQSEMVTIVIVATVLLIVGYFTGMLHPKGQEQEEEIQESKTRVPVSPPLETQPKDTTEDEDEEFSFEPIPDTLVEVFEEVMDEPAKVDEVIELDEELDVTASGRLASLRSEIEDGENKPESREERMKRLFGDR